MAARSASVTDKAPAGSRVLWLDGVRGAAAMFVVLHHIWLVSWPKFPTNTGPWWLGWLLYGHMAVAIFIVVSGFSLSLAPMRKGGQLTGGIRRFLRRRAWRILPAYWAALAVSLGVTALFLSPDLSPGALARSTLVHGALLQDAVGSASPNGALWSIAIEWQIYFVFPIILLLARRSSVVLAVALTAVVVLVAHAFAGLGGVFDKINGLTPQFLALFALGALAAWLGGDDRAQALRRPLGAVSLLALGGFAALALMEGSEWIVAQFFWMDLLFGVGVACMLAVLYAGGLTPLARVLASRLALWLGLFSYSIYLLHDPIVGVLDKYAFGPLNLAPLPTFGLTLVLGLPVIVALCYGFHLLFEAPFLRQRGVAALRTMPLVRPWLRRSASPTPAAPPAAAPSESAA